MKAWCCFPRSVHLFRGCTPHHFNFTSYSCHRTPHAGYHSQLPPESLNAAHVKHLLRGGRSQQLSRKATPSDAIAHSSVNASIRDFPTEYLLNGFPRQGEKNEEGEGVSGRDRKPPQDSFYIIGGPWTPLGCRCQVTRPGGAQEGESRRAPAPHAHLELVLNTVAPDTLLRVPSKYYPFLRSFGYLPFEATLEARVFSKRYRQSRNASHDTAERKPQVEWVPLKKGKGLLVAACPYARSQQCRHCPWMALASSTSSGTASSHSGQTRISTTALKVKALEVGLRSSHKQAAQTRAAAVMLRKQREPQRRFATGEHGGDALPTVQVLEPLVLRPTFYHSQEVNLIFSPTALQGGSSPSSSREQLSFTLFPPALELQQDASAFNSVPHGRGVNKRHQMQSLDALMTLLQDGAAPQEQQKVEDEDPRMRDLHRILPSLQSITGSSETLSTIHCLWCTLDQQRLMESLSRWAHTLTPPIQLCLRGASVLQLPRVKQEEGTPPQKRSSGLFQVVLVVHPDSGHRCGSSEAAGNVLDAAGHQWSVDSPLWGPSHPPSSLAVAELGLVEAVLRAGTLQTMVEVFVCCEGESTLHQLYPVVCRNVSLHSVLEQYSDPPLPPSTSEPSTTATPEPATTKQSNEEDTLEVDVPRAATRRRIASTPTTTEHNPSKASKTSTALAHWSSHRLVPCYCAPAHAWPLGPEWVIPIPKLPATILQVLLQNHGCKADKSVFERNHAELRETASTGTTTALETAFTSLQRAPFWRHSDALETVLSAIASHLLDGLLPDLFTEQRNSKIAPVWYCCVPPPLKSTVSFSPAVAGTVLLAEAVKSLIAHIIQQQSIASPESSTLSTNPSAPVSHLSSLKRVDVVEKRYTWWTNPTRSPPLASAQPLLFLVVVLPPLQSDEAPRLPSQWKHIVEQHVRDWWSLHSNSTLSSVVLGRVLLLQCDTHLHSTPMSDLLYNFLSEMNGSTPSPLAASTPPLWLGWRHCRTGVLDIDPVSSGMVAYGLLDLIGCQKEVEAL